MTHLSTQKPSKQLKRKLPSVQDFAGVENYEGLYKIANQFPGALFIKNDEKRCIFINDEVGKVFGLTANQWRNKTDEEVFGKELADLIKKQESLCLQNPGETFEFIDEIPFPDGMKYFKTKKVAFPNVIEGNGMIIFGNASDITELENTKNKLKATNDYLEKRNELSPHIVFTLDLDSMLGLNPTPSFQRLLGYNLKLLETTPNFFFNIIHKKDKFDILAFKKRAQSLQHGKIITKELRLMKKGRGFMWSKVQITPFSFDKKTVKKVLVSVENIHKLKHLQEKYKRESHYDHLTRIYNRRFFISHLSRYLDSKEPFTLLFVDLDKFKLVNDTYGHDIGDGVLIETAKRLRSVFRRDTDIVARLGGDEFVVMFKGGLYQEHNNYIPKKIKSHFLFPYDAKNTVIHFKPSIGGVYIDSNYEMNPEDVLAQADTAMYRAKKSSDMKLVYITRTDVKFI